LKARAAALAVVCILALPVMAEAGEQQDAPSRGARGDAYPPQNCYGESAPRLIFGETLVGLTNPIGFENQLRLAGCWPLFASPGMFFAFTNLESGVFHYVSPAYTHQGAYLSLTPLSFLNFRLEAAGVHVWPVEALPGAGHFSRTGYRDSFYTPDGIDNRIDTDMTDAGGSNIVFATTLQASLTLAHLARGKLEMLLLNTLGVEYWSVGNDPYYYNIRKDVTLARSDVILTDFGLAAIGVPLAKALSLRMGAFDSLIYIPGGHLVGNNQVGAMVSIFMERLRKRVRGLQPFLQIAGYTNQAARRLGLGLNVVIGIDLSVMLFP
jgi:hypothetical protein